MEFDYSDFSILHGEDDPADARMMGVILTKIGYNGDYRRLSLGHEVADWIGAASNPLPRLILLDINLPGLTGKEILRKLRADERTMSVPILMLTGSSSERDYHDCIQLGANSYIKKTSDLDAYTQICHRFIEGWARVAKQDFF
ncbi:MAG: response regulator [Granulosicoccus sp.]